MRSKLLCLQTLITSELKHLQKCNAWETLFEKFAIFYQLPVEPVENAATLPTQDVAISAPIDTQEPPQPSTSTGLPNVKVLRTNCKRCIENKFNIIKLQEKHRRFPFYFYLFCCFLFFSFFPYGRIIPRFIGPHYPAPPLPPCYYSPVLPYIFVCYYSLMRANNTTRYSPVLSLDIIRPYYPMQNFQRNIMRDGFLFLFFCVFVFFARVDLKLTTNFVCFYHTGE